jgi:ABC-2 type transport system permease protein
MRMEKKIGFLSKRSLKYGSNSIILIAAVVAIAFLVNILVGSLDIKWDFTPNKLFSLTDVSKNLLKDLKTDVTIIGLFDDGKVGADGTYKELTDLLALYQKYDHIKVEYIDPDKNPGIEKQLDEQGTMDLQKGDLIVKSTVNGKEKKKKLSSYDLFTTTFDQSTFEQTVTGSAAEQGFTGAIKFVTSENTPVVYFTQGHNEIDVDSEYTNVRNYLDKNNFEVQTLNLITAGKVPDNAAMLVVAAPKSDLSANEKEAIAAYLRTGGKVVFMFDYLASDPDFTQFNDLLSGYNVAVNYDKVKETDQNMHMPDDEYAILLNVSSNSIIPQAFNIMLKDSRSISILKNQKEYITTTSLVKTSDKAVGEPASAARGESLQGPLDMAVAVENQGGEKASRILVMGNASFISDSAAQLYGNTAYNYGMVFFLQSISWMVESKDELIVPTKSYENPVITINELQASVVSLVLLIVLPLIILGTGMLVYLRRRHL